MNKLHITTVVLTFQTPPQFEQCYPKCSFAENTIQDENTMMTTRKLKPLQIEILSNLRFYGCNVH